MYIIFMKKLLTLKMAAIACAVFMAIGFAYAANVEEIDAPSAAMNKSIPAIVILPDSYEKSAAAPGDSHRTREHGRCHRRMGHQDV